MNDVDMSPAHIAFTSLRECCVTTTDKIVIQAEPWF